ncbi:amidohydrolase family protein, partial [Proteus mirabilis]|uniref:amidohydrolase family protein n=1 Tax=Proteus mirabilis TaxID=584 RepID=UPI0013D2555E
DNWTPARPCQAFLCGAQERKAPVTLLLYPAAAHGFDAPNVTVKLSGLLAEAPAGADATVLAPYFDHVVHRFGAGRILWGSDWPVLTTAGTYADWLAISHALLAPLGSAERAAILGA